MQEKTFDEFDNFCRIAKNPILVSDEYSRVNNSVSRSHSVRERIKGSTSNSLFLMNQEQSKVVRVRSFRRTTRGIVCNKDTLEVRSEISKHSDYLEFQKDAIRASVCDHVKNDMKPLLRDKEESQYVVNIIGSYGVGKSSLCQQLLIPENQVTQYDEGKTENEAQVMRVLIDNEESMLKLNKIENSETQIMKAEPVDAYIVMYAIDDKTSFESCKKQLANVVLTSAKPPVVILVGNKSDLVRCRVVTVEDGKRLAGIYNLKFKEISTSLNHGVDELLVLLVTEVRSFYRKVKKQKAAIIPKQFHDSKLRSSLKLRVSSNAVSRFIRRHFNKSYENLTVNH